MSIEDAYNSLRGALAREAKNADGAKLGAPSGRNYFEADMRINHMTNVELLQALSLHEEND